MANNEGTPLHGDRGAWNVNDFPSEHASDLLSHPQHHVPSPGATRQVAISDGTDWESRLLVSDDIPADIARDAEVTAEIATHAADADAHQSPVTLDANAEAIMSLTTQEIGLDTQGANKFFGGPASGGDAVPTVRALVAADIPAATDADAIHDNVAAEISAITEKATPVNADLLLLEDSADTNNKKRVQIGNLPGGSGASLTVEEADGSPSVSNVTKIKVGSGDLTDEGGGVVRVKTAADASGGGGATDILMVQVFG